MLAGGALLNACRRSVCALRVARDGPAGVVCSTKSYRALYYSNLQYELIVADVSAYLEKNIRFVLLGFLRIVRKE